MTPEEQQELHDLRLVQSRAISLLNDMRCEVVPNAIAGKVNAQMRLAKIEKFLINPVASAKRFVKDC